MAKHPVSTIATYPPRKKKKKLFSHRATDQCGKKIYIYIYIMRRYVYISSIRKRWRRPVRIEIIGEPRKGYLFGSTRVRARAEIIRDPVIPASELQARCAYCSTVLYSDSAAYSSSSVEKRDPHGETDRKRESVFRRKPSDAGTG